MLKIIFSLSLFSANVFAAEVKTCNSEAAETAIVKVQLENANQPTHIYAAPIADEGGFFIYKVTVVMKESPPLLKDVRINKTNCAYEDLRIDGGDEIFRANKSDLAPSFTLAAFLECSPGQIGVCPGNHTSKAFCGNDGRWRCY